MRVRCNHTDGAQHSCTYVDAINRIIPDAWSAAVDRIMSEEFVGKDGVVHQDKALLERFFHEEMMKRTIAKGLRRPFRRAPLLLAR